MCILRHYVGLIGFFKTYECVSNSIVLRLAVCGHEDAFDTCEHRRPHAFLLTAAFASTGHMCHVACIRFLPDGNLDFFASPTSLCLCPANATRTSVYPDVAGSGLAWSLREWTLFSVLRFSAQSKGSGAGLSGFNPAADGDKTNDLGRVAEPISARVLTCERAVIAGSPVLGLS